MITASVMKELMVDIRYVLNLTTSLLIPQDSNGKLTPTYLLRHFVIPPYLLTHFSRVLHSYTP